MQPNQTESMSKGDADADAKANTQLLHRMKNE